MDPILDFLRDNVNRLSCSTSIIRRLARCICRFVLQSTSQSS